MTFHTRKSTNLQTLFMDIAVWIKMNQVTILAVLLIYDRILAVGAASTAYFCIQTRDSPVVTANIDPKRGEMKRDSPERVQTTVARVIMELIDH